MRNEKEGYAYTSTFARRRVMPIPRKSRAYEREVERKRELYRESYECRGFGLVSK